MHFLANNLKKSIPMFSVFPIVMVHVGIKRITQKCHKGVYLLQQTAVQAIIKTNPTMGQIMRLQVKQIIIDYITSQ